MKFGSSLSVLKEKIVGNRTRTELILLVFQAVLLLLLSITIVFLSLLDRSDRLAFYLILVISLELILIAALLLNLSRRYTASAWLTTITMVLGPWGSILLDDTVLAGDFIPLAYIALSILICSILLSEKATLVIAIFQIGALAAVILSSPDLMEANWPSLVAFIVFATAIATVSSFTNRKQIEQIDKQRNQLQLDEVQLRNLSIRDSLTGLYNRRFMEHVFDIEIEKALNVNQGLGIVMVDVDDFKTINDSLGHALGDSVLIHIADILMKSVQSPEIACRYGGDEFTLILPGCSLDEAIKKAESVRLIIENMDFNVSDENPQKITLSFGVSAFPNNGRVREELLRAADNAMYSAKKSGRNRVVAASRNNVPVKDR